LGSARTTAAGLVAAGVLRDSLGAAAVGATQLQLAVPLVRRPELDDPIWRSTTFTKKSERLLNDQMMGNFLWASCIGKSLLTWSLIKKRLQS
jgi:hypothetical protein